MANPSATIGIPGLDISPNNPQSVNLQSGAVWSVPQGNFYLKIPPQSSLQWQDLNTGLWRGFDSGPSNNPIEVQSDGTNFRVINVSGTISGANITTAGTLYTQANTTVSFAAPAAGTPSRTATATPVIGGSLTYTVTAG